MEQLTFLWEELPASLSALPDCGRALPTHAATSRSSIAEFLTALSPNGLSGKTCRVSSVATEDGILVPSSGRWQNSGMGGPTESLTLNTSEFPSDAAVCSLSDVLETGPLPPRFFLSPKACQGILRRAENRGKQLPIALEQALQAVAAQTSETDKETSIRQSRSTQQRDGICPPWRTSLSQ